MTTPDPTLILFVALLGHMGVWHAGSISRVATLLALSFGLQAVAFVFMWTD